jgi:hypothetical protein
LMAARVARSRALRGGRSRVTRRGSARAARQRSSRQQSRRLSSKPRSCRRRQTASGPLREGERVLGDLALTQAQAGELAHLAVVELGRQPLCHELAQRRSVAPESREPPAGVLLADVVGEGDQPARPGRAGRSRTARRAGRAGGARTRSGRGRATSRRRRLWDSDILCRRAIDSGSGSSTPRRRFAAGTGGSRGDGASFPRLRDVHEEHDLARAAESPHTSTTTGSTIGRRFSRS